jgi:hypothetical protein
MMLSHAENEPVVSSLVESAGAVELESGSAVIASPLDVDVVLDEPVESSSVSPTGAPVLAGGSTSSVSAPKPASRSPREQAKALANPAMKIRRVVCISVP